MAVNSERQKLLSRRDVGRIMFSALCAWPSLESLTSMSFGSPLEAELAHEFAHSRLLDVSSDGKRLCLEDWQQEGYPIRVVEVGTWRTLFSKNFGYRINAEFFGDNQKLFLWLGVRAGEAQVRLGVLDIATGNQTMRGVPFDYENFRNTYFPLDEGLVLVKHAETKPRFETTALSVMNYSDNREIKKAPFATEPRGPGSRIGSFERGSESSSTFRLSEDNKILIYAFDDVLVCRSTDTLEVVWTRRIEGDMRCFDMAVSSRGDFVAISFVDARYSGNSDPRSQDRKYYTAIYDGKTGREVACLPLFAKDGIALSPNGRYLSVVKPEGNNGIAVPTVYLYELPSGKILTSLVHDRIKATSALGNGCSVAFTSDERYLVTSGMIVKVWEARL